MAASNVSEPLEAITLQLLGRPVSSTSSRSSSRKRSTAGVITPRSSATSGKARPNAREAASKAVRFVVELPLS